MTFNRTQIDPNTWRRDQPLVIVAPEGLEAGGVGHRLHGSGA